MSNAVSCSLSISIGGKQFAHTQNKTTDLALPLEVSVPAAKAVTSLSTRTDSDTGVLTVAAGHGVTTSDLVDFYWTGGMRRGMTVTATTSTTISIDGGTGDNLPVATTPGVVCIVVSKDFVFEYANVSVLAAASDSTAQAAVSFVTSAPAENLGWHMPTAGQARHWISGNGESNPLSANIVTCRMSHADTTAARNVRVGVAMSG